MDILILESYLHIVLPILLVHVLTAQYSLYMKEGHHTRPATSDSCSDWILERKQWRNIENYYLKTQV